MVATGSIDGFDWLRKQIEETAPDPLKAMLTEMVTALLGAEIDTGCGAGCGEPSGERINSRNGYRGRPWDTLAGTIHLQIPKLRHGTGFPGRLLEPRRRAEKALTAVVAESYLLGVSHAQGRGPGPDTRGREALEEPGIAAREGARSVITVRVQARRRPVSHRPR